MQSHPIPLRLTLLVLVFLLAAVSAQAQGNIVRASVRSVKGMARIYAGGRDFAPTINYNLEPGNSIETGQHGRVVISLTDGGSLITVLPNSKVTLKNFRAAQSARELLEITVGRVIVKIHHISGKPNPYRLNSPAASIAVRGTEFVVDVLLGGETLVQVREGLVEVWPLNNPDNKRLVTTGGRVTIQPGGGISSAFPGPRRSLENVAQSTSDISPIFFSAFADQHLDSLNNPAYASEFREAQGRLLLLPSISEPYYVDKKNGAENSKGPSYYDYSVAPQLTFFTPIPNSRFVVGGGVSGLQASLRELNNYQYSDYQQKSYGKSKMKVLNSSIIAAYSFGSEGRTSVGVGLDRLAGEADFSNRNESQSPGDRYFDSESSNLRFERTRLTVGLTRQLKQGMKIGIHYRNGFNSSRQEATYVWQHQDTYTPSASYSVGGVAFISTSSTFSELGLRFRGALTRRLFYGAEGSYLYERNRGNVLRVSQPNANTQYLARRASVGAGLGFFLTSRILLNLDVAGGLFNSSHPAEQPVSLGGNFFGSLSPMGGRVWIPSSSRIARGTSVSAHWSVQANPWRNLFLSTSSLVTIRRGFYKYQFQGARDGFTEANTRALFNSGLGWKLNPNVITEYLISVDPRERNPSHSLRIRYTFGLGITNEK